MIQKREIVYSQNELIIKLEDKLKNLEKRIEELEKDKNSIKPFDLDSTL